MSPKSQLMLASIAFAALWSAAMAWWMVDKDTPEMAILIAMGPMVGIAWYFGMKFVSQRLLGRHLD
jgi:hypothetical protein